MKNTFNFILETLSGIKATIVGGVFLVASLAALILGAELPLDPAWIPALICGYPLAYAAVEGIISNKGMAKITSSLLITMAMIASIAIGEVFAAGEIAFIMALGEILEAKTVERAKKGIKQLIGLAPEKGRVIVDGIENMTAIENVKKGDVLRVLPGEAVPVDGEVISGNTSVDQSIITGESLPVDKSIGDAVYCGTINRFGTMDVRATKVGEDSSLQKLIRLVREAEENKAPMQRVVDRWAAWLVPIALFIAIITYIFTQDIIRAVTILVVFCPCALALATPTSIMAAIGQATKHGVIIKSGDALERMARVDCVAFDKTGTLTHGKLYVKSVEGDVLRLAASLERYSEHPVAKAIVAHYQAQLDAQSEARADVKHDSSDYSIVDYRLDTQIVYQSHETFLNVQNFKATPGVGVEGDVDGKRVVIGRGATVTVDGVYAGRIIVADMPKENSKTTVLELNSMGVKAVMLTGDNRATALEVAQKAGISDADVYSELMPEHKVERLNALGREGRVVCMIGDGVNDAPALKTAHVGVAMAGLGSDIAIEAADIALMGDDISKIPYLKRLARETLKLIKLNISFSMAINIAAVVLSALALLNPITGALVHNAGSVLVVLSAARLYDRKV